MTEKDKSPKVSIGLAVYNGEKYIKEAIDSILAQTFTDFELIISDNASSDRTEEICREYAERDSRIRYYRNATNIGGINNENLTFALSQGKYFRLAAYDDILAPELLEKCVEVLDRNPSVILCYSTTIIIDQNGKCIGKLDRDLAHSTKPLERFCDFASHHDCEPTYGLVRANILSQTELQSNYPESDIAFLGELSLYGQFYRIPAPLFYRRYHQKQESNYTSLYSSFYEKIAIWRYSAIPDREKSHFSWFDLVGAAYYYHWLQFLDYFHIISRASLTLNERIYCYFYVLCWLTYRIVFERSRNLRQKIFLQYKAYFLKAKSWQSHQK
ncbi:MAG: glycosyltransferase family 2 protein [Xenococcaceae cyanobacterium]